MYRLFLIRAMFGGSWGVGLGPPSEDYENTDPPHPGDHITGWGSVYSARSALAARTVISSDAAEPRRS